MGRVVDRWHLSTPPAGAQECGEHKGKVPAKVHGKGKRWQARYDGPDGVERTSLHRTQTEAQTEVNKQEGAKLTGSWVDPSRGKMKIHKVVFDIWLPATNTIERSKRIYRGQMNRYLIPEWGEREIRSIRPSEAGAWQNLLTSKYELGGQTPNRVARLARAMFHMAVRDRMIPISPFDGITAPTLVESVVNPPGIGEVLQLITHAYHDRYAVMIELCALTGLRSGELRGLRLAQVDFLARALTVREQLVYEPGKGMYLDHVKTAAGRRTLPLNRRAVDLLAAYVAKYPPAKAGQFKGLIFAMPDGKPVGISTADDALKSTCGYAKLRARHWHELRHHYASVLIAGGENPKVVQKRMGHKDVMLTMRIYAHLFAEAEEKTRNVLDDAWTKAAEQQKEEAAESPQPTGTLAESGPPQGVLSLATA